MVCDNSVMNRSANCSCGRGAATEGSDNPVDASPGAATVGAATAGVGATVVEFAAAGAVAAAEAAAATGAVAAAEAAAATGAVAAADPVAAAGALWSPPAGPGGATERAAARRPAGALVDVSDGELAPGVDGKAEPVDAVSSCEARRMTPSSTPVPTVGNRDVRRRPDIDEGGAATDESGAVTDEDAEGESESRCTRSTVSADARTERSAGRAIEPVDGSASAGRAPGPAPAAIGGAATGGTATGGAAVGERSSVALLDTRGDAGGAIDVVRISGRSTPATEPSPERACGSTLPGSRGTDARLCDSDRSRSAADTFGSKPVGDTFGSERLRDIVGSGSVRPARGTGTGDT